ncbi:MAG TPA: magnesium transporter CorA family protein [Solirubrobacterales bacterium]|nr:magnesium transporter CorA family protein [Solirubrobacterales bacterium]
MRFLDHIDRGAIDDLLGQDEYFWLDLDAPSEAEIDTLADLFRFHPLALEDLRRKGQRPKLEPFGDYMFLVYYGAVVPEGEGPLPPDAPPDAGPEGGERIELEEVHAFVSGGYLVTVHDGGCGALDEVRKRLGVQAPSSEQFVVYRVLDALTDTFFPLLEDLEERLERLDEEIFADASPDHLQPLTELRRDLVMVGRVATPQRDMLARHIEDILQLPGLEADSRDYFRDVYDHAIRISDQIDSFRDLLLGSRDAYLSVTSNRLNEISKQLTVVATIFLPLSFVVGFFGQNFGWMVRNINTAADFWLIGGGSMVVSVLVLVIWLRRSSYA